MVDSQSAPSDLNRTRVSIPTFLYTLFKSHTFTTSTLIPSFSPSVTTTLLLSTICTTVPLVAHVTQLLKGMKSKLKM